jgi:hypothetical protein
MMQPRNHLVNFHQVVKIVQGCVTTSLVQVMNKRGAERRTQHGIVAADDNVIVRVSGMLNVLRGCGGLDNTSRMARFKTHSGSLYICSCITEQIQYFRIIGKVHADIPEYDICIVLNKTQTFFIQHIIGVYLSADIRESWYLCVGTLRLTPTPHNPGMVSTSPTVLLVGPFSSPSIEPVRRSLATSFGRGFVSSTLRKLAIPLRLVRSREQQIEEGQAACAKIGRSG